MNKTYIKRDANDCIGCCEVCPCKEEGALYAPCEELNRFYAREEEKETFEEYCEFITQNIPMFLKNRSLGFLVKFKF